jgi:hypothetical protein
VAAVQEDARVQCQAATTGCQRPGGLAERNQKGTTVAA